MKILVTGGAGFIGANFVHYWMNNHPDDALVNVDKLTYAGNPENLHGVDQRPGYAFEHIDIADAPEVQRVFRTHRPDVVVHFAAETHVDRSLGERGEFVISNVVGTQVLLDAALEFQVQRFHHISTDEVFGAIAPGEERAFDETTVYAPNNPYAASKAGADHLVRSYHRSFGLPVTITNCSNNFGPFHTPEKMIPLAISNLIDGKPIPVYGRGLQSRDWLYVEDHCRAVDAVLANGLVGDTYCVGGARDRITNLDVATRLCRLLDKDPDKFIEFVPDRRGHDFSYVVDWTKIEETLGWQPTRTLDDGLAETVQWFLNNETWWRTVKTRQPTFDRLTE